MKRRLIRLACVAGGVILFLALVGCSISKTPESESQPPIKKDAKEGGTLIIARMSDAANLDPHFMSTINAASVIHQKVYEGLVKRDKNMEIRPQLATDWKQIDDVTWEFKLRRGIVFHDGTPFDASAVKSTLDRVLSPQMASPRAALFGKVKEVKIVNSMTVQFNLTEPFTPLLSILASHVGSIISPKAIDQYGKGLSHHPVGTGPFTFQSWTAGKEIVLTKNEKYWGASARVDRVIFRVVPDDSTRIAMLENTEAHVAESIPVTDIERIQASTEMSVYRSEALGTEFIGFNVTKKPLDDIRVRQAIAHAIETDAIIKGVYNNVGTKANSSMGPKVFGYSPAVKAYPYDFNKAKVLLAQAGYPNGFKTTLFTYDRKDRVRVAEVIRSQLKGIGIDAQIKVMEYAAFVDVLENTKEHEIFVSGWGNATGDADYNQYNLFHTKGGGTGNSFMYSNAELDRLIDAGREENDLAKRKQIYARAQEMEMENAVLVPIRNQENLAAINKNIQGFSISPAGYLMIDEVSIQE